MNKVIVTRSANEHLYTLFKSFWREGNTFIQHNEFQGYEGALNYLLHILSNYDGWIVNCDEDVFLTDEKLLDSIISFMQKTGHVYCGVPDGGGIMSHRTNSPKHVNPFFNVFNVGAIRTKIHEFDNSKSRDYAAQCGESNLREPFAGLLYWLYNNFKCAIFTDIETTDGVSTVIKINAKPMLIHSWYSRHYGIDESQTERINRCIEWNVQQINNEANCTIS